MQRGPVVTEMETTTGAPPSASAASEDHSRIAADAAQEWTTGSYEHDGTGNVKKIGDDFFVYNARGRLLLSATAPPDIAVTPNQTYTYDTSGNLLTINTAGRGTTTFAIDGVTNPDYSPALPVAT